MPVLCAITPPSSLIANWSNPLEGGGFSSTVVVAPGGSGWSNSPVNQPATSPTKWDCTDVCIFNTPERVVDAIVADATTAPAAGIEVVRYRSSMAVAPLVMKPLPVEFTAVVLRKTAPMGSWGIPK